jgi:lipopolysaccharide/colanic/teichoic acid biosynthesis glycosyltransferase
MALGTTWYDCCKGLFDFTLALLLFVLTGPLVLLLGVLVRLTSRGSAYYSQTRLGKNGRVYTLHKIRSMAQDCEKRSGAQWSLPGDPRITWLGRLLRKTHLDELPQLWNVLRGEMSLVGPRPERPEFVPTLAEALPHYRERLTVLPGVTGLAQVQLPPDTDLESVRKKLAYDLWYAQNRTFGLDLRIIVATALKMGGLSFARIAWLMRFPSLESVQNAYETRSLLVREFEWSVAREMMPARTAQHVPATIATPRLLPADS